ncbi:MAG: hypothetical protein LBO00_03395 [Zoogloeaceae bacterium]|jgi:hypothetical protein|nr:hypothetical protein [Zoogloeaceae bacterium]
MNPPTIPVPRKPIDWEAIETAYCAGIIPLREIAKQHGVALSSMQKRAKKHGWIRDLSHKVEKRANVIVLNSLAKAGIKKFGGQKKDSGGQESAVKNLTTIVDEIQKEKRQISEKRIVESAATLIAAVQIAHRGEIAELRRQAREFREELDAAQDEGLPVKDRLQMFGMLTSSYGQVIRLEREAYGIDKGNVPRDETDRSIRVEIVSPQAAVRVVAE